MVNSPTCMELLGWWEGTKLSADNPQGIPSFLEVSSTAKEPAGAHGDDGDQATLQVTRKYFFNEMQRQSVKV